MTLSTYHIELRVDFDHDGKEKRKEEILKAAMRATAKEVFATAQLLCAGSKRKPQISFHGGDFFERDKEIDLAEEDIDELIAQAEVVKSQPGVVKFFKVEVTAHPEYHQYFEAADLESAKARLEDENKLYTLDPEQLTWSEVDKIPDAP